MRQAAGDEQARCANRPGVTPKSPLLLRSAVPDAQSQSGSALATADEFGSVCPHLRLQHPAVWCRESKGHLIAGGADRQSLRRAQ